MKGINQYSIKYIHSFFFVLFFRSYASSCQHIPNIPQAKTHLITNQYCILDIRWCDSSFLPFCLRHLFVWVNRWGDEGVGWGWEYSRGYWLLRKMLAWLPFPPNTFAFSVHLALVDTSASLAHVTFPPTLWYSVCVCVCSLMRHHLASAAHQSRILKWDDSDGRWRCETH